MTSTIDAAKVDEGATREQVLSLIVEEGPVDIPTLAERLDLTVAGVRRHIQAMMDEGVITRTTPTGRIRSRGRPARFYIATDAGQAAFSTTQGRSGYEEFAREALDELRRHGGEEAIREFAKRRAQGIEERYAKRPGADSSHLHARIDALVSMLDDEGFAPSLRPAKDGAVLQVCQGHCPIAHIAADNPILCEVETEAMSRMLGVHVQRIATLASGAHACTTCIPLTQTPEQQ